MTEQQIHAILAMADKIVLRVGVDAEIDAVRQLAHECLRLRGLVREAFGEGFRIQTDESGWSYTERDEPLAWAESDARKALEGA